MTPRLLTPHEHQRLQAAQARLSHERQWQGRVLSIHDPSPRSPFQGDDLAPLATVIGVLVRLQHQPRVSLSRWAHALLPQVLHLGAQVRVHRPRLNELQHYAALTQALLAGRPDGVLVMEGHGQGRAHQLLIPSRAPQRTAQGWTVDTPRGRLSFDLDSELTEPFRAPLWRSYLLWPDQGNRSPRPAGSRQA